MQGNIQENNQALYPPEYVNLEVEEGRYLPPVGDVFDHDNPHAHMKVDGHNLTEVEITSDYPFIDESPRMRFWGALYRARARYLIRWLHYFRYGYRIRGRENYKRNKRAFANGGMLVANHVYRWDVAGVLDCIGWPKFWYPLFKDQLSGSDARHERAMGGIPVPTGRGALRKFFEAFDEVHRRKEWIHFFAEEARWDFYAPIRPFKKGAFVFAVRYNIPILPIAYSYRERKGFLKLFSKTDPCITLNLGEPIFPDQELLKTNRNACIDDLRRRTHETIVKLAGIKKNPWTYNQTEP